MTSNAKTFSTTLHCTERTLGADLPASPALGGVLAMDCTEDNCLPPIKPRAVGFQFHYDLPVQITLGLAGQPCVIAATGMGSVVLPVHDPAQLAPILKGKSVLEACEQGLCGTLCEKLVAARKADVVLKETRFYVYEINAAPDELALKGKLIAIPVPPGHPANPVPTK